MNAHTPGDSHSAAADLSALLQLLTDPVATKARLDELLAQEKATSARIAELHAMESETKRLHGTATAINIVCDRRLAAIEAREVELDARAQQLEQSESTRSDAALRRRESAVEARENAAKAESERLAVARKDIEARLAKIKSFSSSL